MRRFIASEKDGIAKFAKANPSVEVIVKKRPFRHPVVRGLYRKCRCLIHRIFDPCSSSNHYDCLHTLAYVHYSQ